MIVNMLFAKKIKIRHLNSINITKLIRHISETSIPKDKCDNYFITTPIFYVNGCPHIGHYYTLCVADAAARYQKLIGKKNIIFSTGTDEHGMKIQQTANKLGVNPRTLCDSNSPKFRELCDSTNISYTDFIRTTELRHTNVAKAFFNKLNFNGFIYKGDYEGWYSITDEAFVPAHNVKEVVRPSGEKLHVEADTGHAVNWTSEINYMFKMSRVRDDLLYWLKSANIKPEIFHKLALHHVTGDIGDLSISRNKDRIPWGIPVPGDDSHTLYVWFEALLNYLTVAGYPNFKMWPPSCQILGKDILKFHAIYWPALLIAADLEPPKQLRVHSHWNFEGYKMSKSKGNVICPSETIEKITADGFRYYLLRTGVPHSDGNWCEKNAIDYINADLANNLGNLLSRCVGNKLNPNQQLTSLSSEFLSNSSTTCKLVLQKINDLPPKIEEHYASFNFNKGIDAIMEIISLCNLFFQMEKPWELKNLEDRTNLDSILHIGIVSCQTAAIALQPIVPMAAEKMLDALNVPVESRLLSDIKYLLIVDSPRKLNYKMPFFQRIKI